MPLRMNPDEFIGVELRAERGSRSSLVNRRRNSGRTNRTTLPQALRLVRCPWAKVQSASSRGSGSPTCGPRKDPADEVIVKRYDGSEERVAAPPVLVMNDRTVVVDVWFRLCVPCSHRCVSRAAFSLARREPRRFAVVGVPPRSRSQQRTSTGGRAPAPAALLVTR